jgi:3-oxoacyl-[acyl-carrier protein] reductase
MKLKDKLVIVTGGTRGIGKAIVTGFAKAKARVLFTYTKNDDLARGLVKELKKRHLFATGFKIDVRDFEAIDKWKDKVLDKYGRVDVLVNNAGITRDKALMMMTREDWQDVIDVNLNGLYNVTRSFITTFLKQKSGNIINISSISGVTGLPRQTNYSASKGGIIAFTKSLAKEVAQYNIRVNAIAPGFIETDMLTALQKEQIESNISKIPLRRFGTPQEVANVVLFLADKGASYITGEVIKVDGGLAI